MCISPYLGILYETSNQPRDGLACYVNAARGSATKNNNNNNNTTNGIVKSVHPNLQQRTKFLQQQLEGAPAPTTFNKSVSTFLSPPYSPPHFPLYIILILPLRVDV